jgi:hypothetical protein
VEPKFAFLTAFTSQGLKLHLKKMQIEHCLEKPVNKELLTKLV